MQINKLIIPSQTIGIIGGGQLGRMMTLAAKSMGYSVVVLDPTPNCPTAQVADEQIVAAYDDPKAIQQLTEKSDVVTYEFENVDLSAATYIEEQGKLPQGAYALEVTQNREKEKQLMEKLNLPVPKFHIVKNASECEKALSDFSLPVVVKTCRGGYDGKGQIKISKKDQKQDAIEFVEKNKHCIIEEWVPFEKEISVVFTRNVSGNIEFFPIAENVHTNHILYRTTAPANIASNTKVKAIEATRVLADAMNVVGTFAIEMFVVGEDIYLNEMAPRPHNSGHFTMEACNISQFSQHIRAICGLPLMPVEILTPATMINILGEDIPSTLRAIAQVQYGFIHLYGKAEAKAKRKMGHITFIGETIEEQLQQFEEAKQ